MWKVCGANMASGRKGSKPVASAGVPSAAPRPNGDNRQKTKAGHASVSGLSGDLVDAIRGLAAVVADHALSELVVDLPDATITLRRGGAHLAGVTGALTVPMPAIAQGMPALPAMPSMLAGPAAAPAVAHERAATLGGASAPAPAVDEKVHVVTSPFVGTFYRRPNPDSTNYVELNSRVDKGAVLCIVEAMKLMNEIEADVAGTVVGILAEDGAPVEYGQALFKIAPA